MIVNIHIVWIIALAIGLMYGILLPAWEYLLWHDLSNQMNKKKLGGVFNSIQGFGSMIGPLFGGLITQLPTI